MQAPTKEYTVKFDKKGEYNTWQVGIPGMACDALRQLMHPTCSHAYKMDNTQCNVTPSACQKNR